jgi:cholesterol transport system auxiliary component
MSRVERRTGGIASAVVLLGTVLLAGCSMFRSDARPDSIYILNVAPPAAGAAPLQGVLIVPRPVVQPGLDTDRIALVRNSNELDYYAASRWGAPLPQVLGAFAVQSLAGSFSTVAGLDRASGPGNFELVLTTRHFEAVYGASGPPEVRVAFDCLLVATAPRKVLGSCNADVSERAADNRMGPVVQAFERAGRRAMEEVRRQASALAGQQQGVR